MYVSTHARSHVYACVHTCMRACVRVCGRPHVCRYVLLHAYLTLSHTTDSVTYHNKTYPSVYVAEKVYADLCAQLMIDRTIASSEAASAAFKNVKPAAAILETDERQH